MAVATINDQRLWASPPNPATVSLAPNLTKWRVGTLAGTELVKEAEV
jgi:hypothetical protein